MRLQSSFAIFILSHFTITTLAVPFVDSNPDTFPTLGLEARSSIPKCPPRSPTPTHSSLNCLTQGPIASNVCSSGSPYCCSGSGKSMVCGPASSTQCTSTTICCINTNGMQICAGEIDFTGPVTITHDVNLLNLNLCLRDEQ